MGLDWAARVGGILGEMGDVHNFAGGSYPWLSDELAIHSEEEKPMFFVSHIPMYVNAGAFDIFEMELVESLLASYADKFISNFAGHYHTDVENAQEYYDLVVIDAIWDDEIRFQQLYITKEGDRFSFLNERKVIE